MLAITPRKQVSRMNHGFTCRRISSGREDVKAAARVFTAALNPNLDAAAIEKG